MKHRLFILFLISLFLPQLVMAEPAAKKFVVVIDAGHGGHDPGAIAKNKKIREKDINLKTALALGSMIERNHADVQVVYTRKTDVFVELHKRAQIANKAKADLFISIHTNSVAKGTVKGAETYTLGMARADENLEVAKRENSVILQESDYKTTYKGFNPNSSESYIIFEFMQDKNMNQSVSFAKKVQSQFKNNAKRIDKGVKQAGFLVLRETTMPSVLIELGYISTPDEAQYLISDKGAQTMAQSIYLAFNAYRKGGNSSKTEPVWTPVESAAEETEPAGNPEVKPVEVQLSDKNQEKDEPAPAVKVEKRPAAQKVSSPEKAENVQKAETTGNAQKASTQDAPVFAVQILTAGKKLPSGDSQFKGLKNVDYYQENGMYKYIYGSSTNYNEVAKKRKEILTKFKDCFIIALRNGEKMDVNEAIRIFKANR